ncbi:MAG: transporter [Pseudomonadota bacterium]
MARALRSLLLLWCLLAAVPVFAQSLEPRSFTNIPVGQHFVLLGAARSEGGLAPTPTSPLQDADLTIDTFIMGYATSFDFFGDSGKFSAATGRVCYEGSAIFEGEFVEGRRCEWADPKFRLSWNFYGSPAMPLEEFVRWTPGLVIGAGLSVSAPWGDYTERQLINAGTNRWVIRPELGMSYTWRKWQVDLMGSVRFFEDNDENFRGTELEQDPLYQVQGHLTYTFNNRSWVSLNANFYRGGQSTVSGRRADDQLENSRWGVTYSLPLTRHQSVKLYGSTGVVTRAGTDFDTLGIGWQYRF